MKKCLEMFDEHLDEVASAFRGDDDTLQPFLLYDEYYNFEVDLSRILMGDLDQFDSPKGPREGGSSFIFFVVQNKAGSGHRCWPVDAATTEIASDGSAILFSTIEGELEVFKSTKNVLHNSNVKLWGGYCGCLSSIITKIAAEEEHFRDSSSEIWTESNAPAVTEYKHKMWMTDTGIAQWMYTLPADSPPLRYCVSKTIYSTYGYMASVITPLYSDKIVTFNVLGLTSIITVEAAMQASIARSRLEHVAATRYGRVAVRARDLYKLIRFKEIDRAVIMPEIRKMVEDTIQFTPWSSWESAVMFFRKQPNCHTFVAIILEMLGLSDKTILGFLGIDLFDHQQKNIRKMARTDWVHGITIEDLNRDHGCYTRVNIDKSVVVFNRFVKRLFNTTITDATENYELEDRARGLVVEEIIGL